MLPSTPCCRIPQCNSVIVRAAATVSLLWANPSWACKTLQVQSGLNPHMNGLYQLRGGGEHEVLTPDTAPYYRPSYVKEGGHHHIFHKLRAEGEGQWLLSEEAGSDNAVAFISSWAVTPDLVPAVDTARGSWNVWQESRWQPDAQFQIRCHDFPTSAVYFTSSLSPRTGGLYLPVEVHSGGAPVFRCASGPFYMYRLPGRWMVGDHVGSDSGVAFADAPHGYPHDATFPPQVENGAGWTISVQGMWKYDPSARVFHAKPGDNVFDTVHSVLNEYAGERERARQATTPAPMQARVRLLFQSAQPAGTEQLYTMNNGLKLPLVGLGTGGLTPEQTKTALEVGWELGYRLIDTASAYNNEEVIGKHLHDRGDRSHAFIATKVWPTDLGFEQTLEAARNSMDRLKTSYIDLYFIHWPMCYDHLDFMDCTHKSGGTWQQSWRAMQRLYAEGILLSLGVSNFDEGLMKQLLDFSSTQPHAVQNFMDPAHTADPVFPMCRDLHIFYQAYAPLRNVFVAEPTADHQRVIEVAKVVAERQDKAVSSVLLRWFVEKGIGVIPRSATESHLDENMDVFRWELSRSEVQALDAVDVHLLDDDHEHGWLWNRIVRPIRHVMDYQEDHDEHHEWEHQHHGGEHEHHHGEHADHGERHWTHDTEDYFSRDDVAQEL